MKPITVAWSLLLLSTAAATPGRGSSPLPSQEAPLPPATAVVQDHIEALGGEAAIRRQKFVTATGKVDAPSMGLAGEISFYQAAPDKYLVKMSIAGAGEFIQGYDGRVGWSMDPLMGPMVLGDDVLRQIQLEADFYAQLHYATHYPTMETVARTSFEGEDCYKLRLVDVNGRESWHYFSVESGLLVGREGHEATPGGDVYTVMTFAGYKRYADTLVPTRITQSGLGQRTLFTLDEVHFKPIDATTFQLPRAIEHLLQTQEEEAPEEDEDGPAEGECG